MKEFKGTRGEVKKRKFSARTIIFIQDGRNFIDVWGNGIALVTDEEMDANANLIIDAFKVRQSINCELSELLEQRNEMLAMLEDIKDSIEGGESYDLYRIEQLIKKVKDNG
jgi:hypothetical protein